MTTATSTDLPTPDQARAWLRRWDDQQATYFSDREERFAVIGDVLDTVLQRPDPLIVDLGAGPGSLSARLLDRFPSARIVGADMDPLLLGLAELAYGCNRFRTVQVDLRAQGWLDALDLDRAPDAFVSTTALHWLDRGPLMNLLTAAATALAPRGVVVDGDHLQSGQGRLDELGDAVAQRVADRAGRVPAEDWAQWWDAVRVAPELAGLARARDEIDLGHEVSDVPTVADYLDALRAGGCLEAGSMWQVGDDRVIVGLR